MVQKLSDQEQLALLEKKNAFILVKDYVALGQYFLRASYNKVWETPIKFRLSFKINDTLATRTAKDKKIHQNLLISLSSDEATKILANGGHFCQKAQLKMLETFSPAESKEILLEYCKSCDLPENTQLKILKVFGKEDVKDIFSSGICIREQTVRQFFQMYPKKDIPEFLIHLIENKCFLSYTAEEAVLKGLTKPMAKAVLLKQIVCNKCLHSDTQLRLCNVFGPKDIYQIYSVCLDNGVSIWENAISKAMETLSEKDAYELLQRMLTANPNSGFFLTGCNNLFLNKWFWK